MVFHLRLFILTILYCVLFLRVRAQRNVTLDDQDLAIVYAPAGAWSRSADNSLDYGGAHMLTQNPAATATFNFTGVAIYFLSPKWPYAVTTAVSLDSGPITLIDLVDHSRPNAGQGPETVQSQVVWSATGLTNTRHTLVISVGQGQPFGIVDGLIYTDMSPASSSTSSRASTTATDRIVASATSSTDNSAALRKKKLSIALGVVFGILALILIFVIIWFCYLPRRGRPTSEAWTIDGPPHDGNSPTTNGNGNGQGYTQSHWVPSGYPVGQPHGYPMEQMADGTWRNAQYGFVGNIPPPPITALQPAQQAYYGHPPNPDQNGYYDQGAGGRAPNRYMPGYTLSTITEKSTPQMVGAHSPPLPNSPSIGALTPASFKTEELAGYYTAPASEGMGAGGREAQPGLGDARDARKPYYGVQTKNENGGTPTNTSQPPTTNGKPASYWI
ncbi:hypothetical protein M413DRAFT_447636 [Hebeloma cylindrosporum]|uniref:Transmembrane protein n=1 Tax=Hebeloma cylindrosporum TaxID=76867 RepID=A0A0C3BPX8_HEBCY|nr:hypothetical protein M413DRAFT_447636 [Hebeloma cylindrosporum h7]